MAMTDPIADMLTRIRNANSAYHEKVEILLRRLKQQCSTSSKKKVSSKTTNP